MARSSTRAQAPRGRKVLPLPVSPAPSSLQQCPHRLLRTRWYLGKLSRTKFFSKEDRSITDRIPPTTFSTDLRWPEGHLAGEGPGCILEPKKILLQLNRFRDSTEEMTGEAAGSNQSPDLLWGNQTLDLNQTMASRSHERAFPEPSLDRSARTRVLSRCKCPLPQLEDFRGLLNSIPQWFSWGRGPWGFLAGSR